MRPKGKAFIQTYGCQMNKYDSEVAQAILEDVGYEFTPFEKEADLILLNTCSVRRHAEERIFSRIGTLGRLKRRNPGLTIGILGCMAKRLGHEIFSRFPYVDFAVGPNDLSELKRLVQKASMGCVHNLAISGNGRMAMDFPRAHRHGDFHSFVPVSFGCDSWCSYCIVPIVRGRFRSRRSSDILSEVRRLASLGVKEVTLLGQNITQYGQDLDSINLAMLLKELEEIEGLRRVRFITSHPAFVSKDLIFAVRDLQKPCRHFHLPLQSGSDKVLRLMRRGYTTELFARLVDKIREAIPDASITTDLIVGFPGEGEEDFQETLLFLSRLQLDAVFGFQFSKRPGTKAEGLPNQVPQDVKRRRLQEVFSLQRGITLKKNKALCGEVQDVMVEGDNPKNPNEYMGRTEQNKVVVFPKKRVFSKGEIVQIRISEAGLWSLRGQIEG